MKRKPNKSRHLTEIRSKNLINKLLLNLLHSTLVLINLLHFTLILINAICNNVICN